MWLLTPERRVICMTLLISSNIGHEVKLLVLGGGFIATNLENSIDKIGPAQSIKLVTRFECDLTNRRQVVNRLSGFLDGETTVIMTACVTRLHDNSFKGFEKNVNMVENLSQILSNKIRSIIYISSVDVYGVLPEDSIIHEALPLRPGDYYSMSKVVGEFILRERCHNLGIPLTILRLTGVFGPGDHGKSTISNMVSTALNHGIIHVHGDGLDERDFLTVEDLVSVVDFAVANPRFETFNIATGNSLSIKEIANIICCHLGCQVVHVPPPPTPVRCSKMRFNISKLRDSFPNFSPTMLHDGVRLYLEQLLNSSTTEAFEK